ncbi:YggU family protein [Candidatus Woesearchaeota archaeon]|nr:YggU family protein [Candidatus Woesearchaeota archaeon]
MNINEFINNNRLNIIVKPNSPKNQIKDYDKNREALRVEIKAPAEDNKANIEIIKFFSKLTKKDVRIVSGLTNKKKILEFK